MQERITKEKLQNAKILPEAIDTVIDINKWLDDNEKKTMTDYGHAVGMLAQVICCGEGEVYDVQIENLRKKAQYLIDKYGEHVIEFMRPELRETLNLSVSKDK